MILIHSSHWLGRNIQHLCLDHDEEEGSSRPLDSFLDIPVTSTEINFTPVSTSTTNRRLNLLELAMDFLTAPALSTLVVCSSLWPVDKDTSLLYSFNRIHLFIQRSNCTLTVLVLSGLPVPDR